MFREKLGEDYALVTGASSGIGLAYVQELAKDGVNLLLVSNQEEALENVRNDLIQTYSVKVHTICMDLSDALAPQQILDYCHSNDIVVSLLINNAGMLVFNSVIRTDTKRVQTILGLHVQCVTEMCRLFGEEMSRRRKGYIINMSSMSAWMAFPGIAMYNATKSYIYNYSCALHYELRPFNVYVTAICPGAINTSLFGLDDKLRRYLTMFGVMMTPEKLVRTALKKSSRGKMYTIPGVLNHIFVFFAKHIPDWLVFFLMKRVPAYREFLPDDKG